MIKEEFEFIFVYFLKLFVLLTPEFLLKIFLRLIIPIAKLLLYNRQKLMLKNFKSVFHQMSSKDVVEKINNVWFNIGWTFLISIKYLYNPKKIVEKIILNKNFIQQKLSGNTIIVTAHIGNWELLAQRLVLEGYKIAAIVRPLRNKFVELQVKKLRESLGGKVFYAHQLNEIMKWLKSGGIVYLLPDQHIVEGSVRVDFLGKKAFTTPVVTLLNKRLGSKILPMFCIKINNHYKVFIEDYYNPFYTENLRKDLEYNTLQINKIIEKYIYKYPDQWMWFHRRWKEK
jgi:KDO2-lipid IV(A) lauroyltransferase